MGRKKPSNMVMLTLGLVVLSGILTITNAATTAAPAAATDAPTTAAAAADSPTTAAAAVNNATTADNMTAETTAAPAAATDPPTTTPPTDPPTAAANNPATTAAAADPPTTAAANQETTADSAAAETTAAADAPTAAATDAPTAAPTQAANDPTTAAAAPATTAAAAPATTAAAAPATTAAAAPATTMAADSPTTAAAAADPTTAAPAAADPTTAAPAAADPTTAAPAAADPTTAAPAAADPTTAAPAAADPTTAAPAAADPTTAAPAAADPSTAAPAAADPTTAAPAVADPTTADPCAGVTCQNSGVCSGGTCDCTNTGGYTGTNCEIDPCAGVTCQNSGVCSGGTCDCTNTGGYTGTNCEIAPDQCASVTCQNDGVCNPNTGMCDCTDYFYGTNCANAKYQYNTWGEWSACPDCGTGEEKTQTRTCQDLETSAVATDVTKCVGAGLGDYTSTAACNAPACVVAYNPCEKSDPCGAGGTCAQDVTNGYKCNCNSGYENPQGDTQKCIDIDDCATVSLCHSAANTLKASVSKCLNTEGDYECICANGYTRKDGDKKNCYDVDECTLGTDNCDTTGDRGMCTNNAGSFVCTCKLPYMGAGTVGTCKEDRLVSTSAATKVTDPFSDLQTTEYGWPLDTGIYNAIYATKSGTVAFTKAMSATVNTRRAFPSPNVKFDMLSFPASVGYLEVGLLSCYWANIVGFDSAATSGMYVQHFTKTGGFTAIDAIPAKDDLMSTKEEVTVVTWKKAKYDDSKNEYATFQMLIATDYVNTEAMCIYQDREMNWNPVVAIGSPLQIRMGTCIFDEGSTISTARVAFDHPLSAASTAADRMNLLKMDAFENGKKKYTLSNNVAGTFVNPSKECKDWIDADATLPTNLDTVASTCPTSKDQMVATLYKTFSGASGQTCYKRYSTMGSDSSQFLTHRCCYYDSDGALVPDHAAAMGWNLVQIYDESSQTYTDTRTAYTHCCVDSQARCSQYLARRLLSTSTNYVASKPAASNGDPHITTVDGEQYTFNGYGQYMLVKITDEILIVARTGVVKDDQNQNTGATAFVSVAAQMINADSNLESDIGELRLNSAGDAVEVIQNKEAPLTPSSWPVMGNRVAFFNDTLAFASGVSVKVVVAFKMMGLTITLPSEAGTSIGGLYGTNDGDETNDIKDRNGSPAASTSEQHIYDAMNTWEIEMAEDLFRYETNEYQNTVQYIALEPAYAPTFFPAAPADLFTGDPDAYNSAKTACSITDDTALEPTQKRCLFDIAQTGNEAAGQETSAQDVAFDTLALALANYAPEFATTTKDYVMQATVGQSIATHTAMATDQNNDALTYSIAQTGLSTPPVIDASSGVLSWTSVPSDIDTTSAMLQIKCSDGTVEAVESVQIKLCQCTAGQGTCQFGQATGEDPVLDVPCSCNNGYDGSYCQNDKDGCTDNPCYPGLTCTDEPASEYPNEFTCPSCPEGMSGNGQTCIDVNECDTNNGGCQHTCENLPASEGGFRCTCNAGFYLDSANQRDCIDVNECATDAQNNCDDNASCANIDGGYTCTCTTGFEAIQGDGMEGDCVDTNECLATPTICDSVTHTDCANNMGSYACVCKPGYKNDLATGDCVEIDECATGATCDQICTDKINTYECECNSGYTLNADKVSCDLDPSAACTAPITCDDSNGDIAANCAMNNGAQECTCPAGFFYTGYHCKNINECDGDHACNLATSDCVDNTGATAFYSCTCKTGYEMSSDGVTCVDTNECAAANDPCAQLNGNCQNTDGSYECPCPSGYMANAETSVCEDVNECGQLNNCDSDNGECTNTVGSYTCACATGYTGNGYLCTDLNECNEADRGGCEQTCSNSVGSYTCGCGEGYKTDPTDSKNCVDVDECTLNYDNCQEQCTNTVGGFTCSCGAGFKLNTDGASCIAESQCETDPGCSDGCARINSQDQCFCPAGYVLGSDTTTCEDVDECDANANPSLNTCDSANNVVCRNTIGSHVCDCVDSNYARQSDKVCVDKDECSSGTHTCTATQDCANKAGGFDCNCKAGYTADGTNCVDVNECDSASTYSCPANSVCSNTVGAYECNCNTGYTDNGGMCMDIDECTVNNQCGQVCTNTDGSFTCSCGAGFNLAGDGLACIDINECTSGVAGCEQICTNNDGGFLCSCQNGFTLAADGKSCTPGTVCAVDNDCSQNCAQINGADTCSCKNSSYTLNSDAKTCDDVNECDTASICPGTSTCNNEVGYYTCDCADGFFLSSNDACDSKHGGYTEWSAWGSCSATCKASSMDPTRMRSRNCTNPAPVGEGIACQGSSTDMETCNTDFCPKTETEETYGAKINLAGSSATVAAIFAVKDQVTDLVASAVNDFCNQPGNFSKCCPFSGARQTTNTLEWTNDQYTEVGGNYPRDASSGGNSTETDILYVAKAPRDNPLCADGDANASRKRRGVDFNNETELVLDQASMILVLSDSELQDDIIALLGANAVVVITVSAPDAATTMMPSTEQPAVTEAPKSGMAGWLIAVIVISVLIAIAIIIIIVVLLIKRPSKVVDGGNENNQQHNQQQNQQQNNQQPNPQQNP